MRRDGLTIKTALLSLIVLTNLSLSAFAAGDVKQIDYSMFDQPDLIKEEVKNIKWDALAANISNNLVDWEELLNSLPNYVSARTLRVLRNMPFAVAGYKFKSSDLMSFYSQFAWYRTSDQVKSSIDALSDNGTKLHFLAKYRLLSKPTKKNAVKLKLLAEHKGNSLLGARAQLRDFYVNNSTAYILDDDGNIQIVDATKPQEPKKIDSLSVAAKSMFLSNNYLYVVNKSGLSILDASGTEKPGEIGHLSVDDSSTKHIYVMNDIAYLSGNELQLIDVKQKSSPKFMSTYKSQSPVPETGSCHFEGFRPRCIYASNERVHILEVGNVSCENDMGNAISYEIADISDSAHPRYIGSLPRISGAFLTGSDSWVMVGRYIIDIGEPDSPVIIEKRSICENCLNSNGHLTTKIDTSKREFPKLLLIDISNPLLPSIAGTTDFPSHAGGICKQQISGDALYLLTCNDSLLIYRMK